HRSVVIGLREGETTDLCGGPRNFSELQAIEGNGERERIEEEVHPEGLEPSTCGSEDRCSIQLSYGCISLDFLGNTHTSCPNLLPYLTPGLTPGDLESGWRRRDRSHCEQSNTRVEEESPCPLTILQSARGRASLTPTSPLSPRDESLGEKDPGADALL